MQRNDPLRDKDDPFQKGKKNKRSSKEEEGQDRVES